MLLDADLCGVESHGIQRLIRYHGEITEGIVNTDAVPETIFETSLSAVIEGNDAMGQLLGVQAMNLAIEKAESSGELTSGYKGYGYGLLCEIATAILSGGTTPNYVYKKPGAVQHRTVLHCAGLRHVRQQKDNRERTLKKSAGAARFR